MKEQGLFHQKESPEPVFTDTLELDLGSVEPSLAGPKRPQDRIALSAAGATVRLTVTDDGALSHSQSVMFVVEGVNMLNNRGFQVAGKKGKQAKYWKGIGLLPGDKRVCKPISETEYNCEFQFSATPSSAAVA